jgi:hypothetical protein
LERTAEDDGVAALLRARLGPVNDLTVNRIAEIRQDEPDRPGAREPQAARHDIWPISELLDRGEHSCPRLRRDAETRIVVHDA